jgi:predicted nuclease with RNAse H fold
VTPWAGVDVGGRRKGFDVAVIDADSVVAVARRCANPVAVLDFLTEHQPRLVAVDSPRCAAPAGTRSRAGERRLAREICGIRYTPSQDVLDEGNPYYEWIVHGLELYHALERGSWNVIECFPTASWTRCFEERGRSRTRAAWTRAGLVGTGLVGIPEGTNLDVRDAIAAALTARLSYKKLTETFAEIEVPRSGVSWC